MIKVCEIFKSIQGESTWAGWPCVFVRLTGCNLRCSYCDTTYAYEGGKELSISKIIEKVIKYNCSFVDVTGGEPLIQADTFSLVTELLDEKFHVLVETNGSIDASSLDKRAIKILDIKCPDSGESDKMHWDNLKCLEKNDEIKFVLSSKADYEWAKELVLKKLPDEQTILISPAFGKVELDKLAEWIIEDSLNVRLQPQIHKYIWPSENRST